MFFSTILTFLIVPATYVAIEKLPPAARRPDRGA
jgi:hypothetical protein